MSTHHYVSRRQYSRKIHLILIAVLVMPVVSAESVDMAAVTKQNEIVPCLLPARIRKLGNMTYPERRRLVEVSARDCRLKGGEFTYYDRAKPEAAVAFFQKLADQGDAEAQVSLGDVYQYLFTSPDYEQAAYWYQMASDAGSKTGMMQLARLYERGLGVEADGLMATNLWREATGAGEELVRADELLAARTEAAARIEELTEALRVSNERAESVRYELAQDRKALEQRWQQLATQEDELANMRSELQRTALAASNQNTVDQQEVERLKTQLAQAERAIEDQRFQMESMEDNLNVREVQLAANLRDVQRRNARLNEELSKVTAEADDKVAAALAQAESKDQEISLLRQDLATAQASLSDTDSAYSELTEQLQAARQAAAQASTNDRRAQRRIAKLEEQTAEQLALLESQRLETESLSQALNQATAQASDLKNSLARQIDATAASEARFAATEAQLQDVQVKLDQVQAQLARANQAKDQLMREKTNLEQQIAAAGNDNQQQVVRLQELLAQQNENFTTQQQQIERLNAQVEQYSSELNEIRLQRESYAMRAPLPKMLDTSSIRFPRNVKLGKYHAIVIGNNNYNHLTNLENAQNDARAVHELLQSDYRFESELLLDATREQTFEAFGRLSAKADENDLVLIYYAGHGLSTQNGSYWLPVEIKSKEDAENVGLSSFKIAKWVSNIPAKHVLIVADSCYSGAGIETSGGFRYDIKTLEDSLPFFLRSKSRTMLSSGGEAPVMDTDGADGDHSVFAKAFLGLLNENRGVLHAGAVHDYLVERVKYAAQGVGIRQTPQFGSIESAGHENGQFVFLHKSVRT